VPVVLVRRGLPVGDTYEAVRRTVGYTGVAVVYAVVVYKPVAVAPGTWLHRFLASKLPRMRTYGKYSYALYLIHSPLDAMLRRTSLFAKGDAKWAESLFMPPFHS
jgi:peptidoglycan/LPS O-acetylase OafA/YrhL